MRLNLKIIYSHRGNNNNMLDNIVYIFVLSLQKISHKISLHSIYQQSTNRFSVDRVYLYTYYNID